MIRNLLNTLKNKKKKAKGFTLIELIIVIAIIAILAAIAIPKFMEIRENGNKKSDLSTAKNIQTTVASLIADDKIDTSTGFVVSTAENAGSTAPGDLVRNNLQDEPEVKSNAAKTVAGSNLTYFVSVSANGNIEVYVGNSAASSARIYPDATIANW